MLITLSPSKTLDLDSPSRAVHHTIPELLDESQRLVARLRVLSAGELAVLMRISARLAELNHARFASWHTPFTVDNARPALLTFQGDVYQGLDAGSLTQADLTYAQDHLRILSGLYGALRPLDLIQPYRLEMGTRVHNARGKDLYAFWGERISESLNRALEAQGDDRLINLASNEYFRAVRPASLRGRVITPVFKEAKGGSYRVIGVYAKRARGLMARFILRHGLRRAEDVRAFDAEGYVYRPRLSGDREWVFTRG